MSKHGDDLAEKEFRSCDGCGETMFARYDPLASAVYCSAECFEKYHNLKPIATVRFGEVAPGEKE